MRLGIEVVETHYWVPGANPVEEIVKAVKDKVSDGDVIFVSEKAISTALGHLVDERLVKPSWIAKLFVRIWVRGLWVFFFSKICHLRRETVEKLRRYPIELGARHKIVALKFSGILACLKHFSEGGIDASNLPYSYVALPLNDPKIAEEICEKLRVKVIVAVVDGDSTFKIGNAFFSTRKSYVKGIQSFGGFLTYLICRALRAEEYPTLVALAGGNVELSWLMRLARKAVKEMRGSLGRTAWDVAEHFGVGLDQVTWKMLMSIKHKPIAIVKASSSSKKG
ncbi:MAG: hypothetical protein DRJ33_06545 [Candidatus Methanomethylicota archaeon]|uniref:Coenzyme F420:L-glutamate ligase-like domain-containing protein n=1 Tax=Thermoproteota archaeon TaxID=2056631 RepID=A0A497EV21_9CREN|nr:MAG: hypothetical protein DRJ33_06545 [Candidatus Verstraetearchaeota archaeon]